VPGSRQLRAARHCGRSGQEFVTGASLAPFRRSLSSSSPSPCP
jgi:hypothetical protein